MGPFLPEEPNSERVNTKLKIGRIERRKKEKKDIDEIVAFNIRAEEKKFIESLNLSKSNTDPRS